MLGTQSGSPMKVGVISKLQPSNSWTSIRYSVRVFSPVLPMLLILVQDDAHSDDELRESDDSQAAYGKPSPRISTSCLILSLDYFARITTSPQNSSATSASFYPRDQWLSSGSPSTSSTTSPARSSLFASPGASSSTSMHEHGHDLLSVPLWSRPAAVNAQKLKSIFSTIALDLPSPSWSKLVPRPILGTQKVTSFFSAVAADARRHRGTFSRLLLFRFLT